MEQKRIHLSSPHMSGQELEYIQNAFDTNWIAPLGPHVNAFEHELAAFAGVKGALALNSGTAAIHLALKLLHVGPGDIVFCSSLTFVATANPILYLGAQPVFIDSEPDTWNMSPHALEHALDDAKKSGNLPKALVVVHLYGQSADMEPILSLCRQYGVPVIEDAAESLGSTYKGKASGSLGLFGIYSFNGNKIITTSGGGMLVSDDIDAIEKARYWSTQSKLPARHYEHDEVGYNYRMSNILAGIGRAQLRVLPERVRARRAIFMRYNKALSSIEGLSFMPEASFGIPNRWLTALTIDTKQLGKSPEEVIVALEKENIEARPVWKPLHLQPLFSNCNFYSHNSSESISEQLFYDGICLPSGSNLSVDDQERVIETLKWIIQK